MRHSKYKVNVINQWISRQIHVIWAKYEKTGALALSPACFWLDIVIMKSKPKYHFGLVQIFKFSQIYQKGIGVTICPNVSSLAMGTLIGRGSLLQ